jgi:hypothetical protein
MILWLGMCLALGGEVNDSDVVREVAAGVTVNWTDLTLHASGVGRTGGTEGRKAIEQLARREVEASMRQGSGRIPVTVDRSLDDLRSVKELADSLQARVSRWVVTEARYFASGNVELDAELSLQDLLKPYTLKSAEPVPERLSQPDFSGLLIDARGTRARPAWAPRVLDPSGEVLFGGGVWSEHAVSAIPVVYVSDPAHAAARRVGDRPFVVVADGARGPDLVLSEADAKRFRSTMTDAEVLGMGSVVVVLRP